MHVGGTFFFSMFCTGDDASGLPDVCMYATHLNLSFSGLTFFFLVCVLVFITSLKYARILSPSFLTLLLPPPPPPDRPLAQIPPEYGGTSPDPLGRSSDERSLMALAASLGPTALPPASTTTPVPGNDSGNGSGIHGGGGGGDGGVDGGVDVAAAAEMGPQADALVDHGSIGAVGNDTDSGNDVIGDERGSGAAAARVARQSSSASVGGFAAAGGVTTAASTGIDRADDGKPGRGEGGGVGEGRGLTQRLASVVRRMRGNATRAYLGVENKFHYDTQRRMWVIEGGGGRGGGARRKAKGGGGRRGGREGGRQGVGDKSVSSGTYLFHYFALTFLFCFLNFDGATKEGLIFPPGSRVCPNAPFSRLRTDISEKKQSEEQSR